MQMFPCPFCGQRDETEFHFAVEAGHARPEGEVSAEAWAAYLYQAKAPKGVTVEVWQHVTCGEYFLLKRDTESRSVLGSEPLPRGAS